MKPPGLLKKLFSHTFPVHFIQPTQTTKYHQYIILTFKNFADSRWRGCSPCLTSLTPWHRWRTPVSISFVVYMLFPLPITGCSKCLQLQHANCESKCFCIYCCAVIASIPMPLWTAYIVLFWVQAILVMETVTFMQNVGNHWSDYSIITQKTKVWTEVKTSNCNKTFI